MFKVFSFKFGNIINLNNIEKINNVMNSFLDSSYIWDLAESYKDNFSKGNDKEMEKGDDENFIELKQYEDMYLLTIDLKGISLRELSIRYDPGIIEINLNRSEIQKNSFRQIYNNILVKKVYNRKFENIEEIDTSQILKSIDNGILSIRMQKKYTLESVSSVIDVDSYVDN